MMHRLARIAVQIEVLQNDAVEWFKLVGVRDHEHFGVAQDSGERDHVATPRRIPAGTSRVGSLKTVS
jgi:hypothetical protein